MPSVRRVLWQHGRGFPFATNLSLISIPIGLLAITIGPEISRAFGNVFHASPIPVYVWGTVLLLGGAQVVYGIGRQVPSTERAGLYVLAVAYAFYGVCVIIGLGRGGLVTGPTFVVLAVSCVQRARAILARAKAYDRLEGENAARGPGS